MFNINFNLRLQNSKNETPIFAVIRYDRLKIVFPIGIKINPKYWNKDNQKAKQSVNFPTSTEFNLRLENIKQTITETYNRFLNEHDNSSPSTIELSDLLKEKLRPDIAPSKVDDFNSYYELRFIKHLTNKINTKTGLFIATKTIQGHKRTLSLLKEFKTKIPFEKIDLDFYNDFIEFLKEKRFSINTIGKHIKLLKTVLFEAQEDYKTVFVSKRFKSFSEETTAIYLNEIELTMLEDIDLSNDKRLSKVRDFFLLGCWTGLRFSDLLQLKPEHIGINSIQLKAQKTNKSFVTPIFAPSRRILDKYIIDGKQGIPKGISNQKLNKYVKELGKMLPELHVKISVQESKGNLKISKELCKYEMISSHTARRSYATNQFKSNAPIASIMASTGHKTQKEFLKYIRMTDDEHIQKLIENYNERKLKVV